MTSLSTMGIGLLTLSISQAKPKADEHINTTGGIVAEAQVSDDDHAVSALFALESAPDITEAAELTPIPTAIPTPSPTPTPIPVYPFEEKEGMDAFIDVFFTAKASSDVDKLKSVYLDPSKVETREQLQKMVQYIEDYRNVKTYSKKSFEEGAYIVYAYHEIKFSSINTLAPGLSKFYVITDDNGNFKIVSDMAPDVEEYFNARNEDEDVIELIQSTNAKGEEAKARDEDLMIFWNGLDELARRNAEPSEQNDQSTQNNQNEQTDQGN